MYRHEFINYQLSVVDRCGLGISNQFTWYYEREKLTNIGGRREFQHLLDLVSVGMKYMENSFTGFNQKILTLRYHKSTYSRNVSQVLSVLLDRQEPLE